MFTIGGHDVRNIMKLPRDQMLAFARYQLALKICPGLVVADAPRDTGASTVTPYRETVRSPSAPKSPLLRLTSPTRTISRWH